MLQPLRIPLVLSMLVAVLVSACVTAQLDSVWKDPLYQARPHKIMVIGVSNNAGNRRIFEDEFARQLKAHGTEAIASYTVLPDRQEGDQAVIAAKVAQMKADTVLITRIASKKTEQIYVPGTVNYPPPYVPGAANNPPPYYGTWQDYYGYGYQAMSTPGHMVEEEFAVIETNLYEARNDKLVWTTSYKTGLNGPDQARIKSYIGVMVKAMVAQGLLGK